MSEQEYCIKHDYFFHGDPDDCPLCEVDDLKEEITRLREQLERAREALRSAQDLIFRHHNCSVRVELGQLCPHCTRDGRQPEIDLIAKALKQQEVGNE